MKKIWGKDYDLNELIEAFTVGEDYILDMRLVPADCVASTAHARMLASIGLLKDEELKALHQGLKDILTLHREGEFIITRSQEDCHTAIEAYLTDHCGEAGKKIHTGRSRNDQVLTDLRLYTRSWLHEYGGALGEFVEALFAFAEKNTGVPMPGRTHLQIAMPSSVGLWAAAYAEELLDLFPLFHTVYDLNNQCPLGSAAGYGVPLPLDREMTARELGFDRVQNNVLYAADSRGKIESIVLEMLEQAVITCSRLAQDLMLYSLPEFGYFSLPKELCSGSSIMPQKKNPDALELVRGRSSSVSAACMQVKNILRALPSGYNRDVQETKEPLFRGFDTALSIVKIMTLTINSLETNESNLKQAFPPEIFATDAALERVMDGVSFREAYRQVGLNLESLVNRDPSTGLTNRTSAGTAGNLGIEKGRARLGTGLSLLQEKKKRTERAIKKLIGWEVQLSPH